MKNLNKVNLLVAVTLLVLLSGVTYAAPVIDYSNDVSAWTVATMIFSRPIWRPK